MLPPLFRSITGHYLVFDLILPLHLYSTNTTLSLFGDLFHPHCEQLGSFTFPQIRIEALTGTVDSQGLSSRTLNLQRNYLDTEFFFLVLLSLNCHNSGTFCYLNSYDYPGFSPGSSAILSGV